MNLLNLENNKNAEILSIKGGIGIKQKLSRLGIRPGVVVTKINHSSGPVILKVGSAKLAIGRKMSERIILKDENSSCR
jgi:Fe2+ transport system protein FeoA